MRVLRVTLSRSPIVLLVAISFVVVVAPVVSAEAPSAAAVGHHAATARENIQPQVTILLHMMVVMVFVCVLLAYLFRWALALRARIITRFLRL